MATNNVTIARSAYDRAVDDWQWQCAYLAGIVRTRDELGSHAVAFVVTQEIEDSAREGKRFMRARMSEAENLLLAAMREASS